MEPTDVRDEPEFVELSFDWWAECYRNELGQEVKFAKEVTVRMDGDEGTYPLAYTRVWMGVKTNKPRPILRLYGQKLMLNGNSEDDSHGDLEVSVDSIEVVR